MDLNEYRQRGKMMVDYIADYLEAIRERHVFPDVEPGYMRELLPHSAPEEGENFTEIMKDVERVIMPGVTHWQSPYFHGYFQTLNSPASLLGDMLADGINAHCFTWASNPAGTELEIIVTDWIGQMMGLPKEFLHSTPDCIGGGVIQSTSSECNLVALLAAREAAYRRIKEFDEKIDETELNGKLMAYASDQSHYSVGKAARICGVKVRFIETDSKFRFRKDKLSEAITSDKENGLVPFFVCATLGTTGVCAFDDLRELGPLCVSEKIWIHVDAAYAGTAFICPAFRKWMEGVEFVESFAFSAYKWMLVHIEASVMWVKDSNVLNDALSINPLYLQHHKTGSAVDFKNWQIPVCKKFRALKLWFVIRNYGIKNLQTMVQKNVALARVFEENVRADSRFEIPAERHLGLVVFRIRDSNEQTEDLLRMLNASRKLHCVPARLKEKYVIRYVVTSANTTVGDIQRDWQLIQEFATNVLSLQALENGISNEDLALDLADIGL